LKRGLLSGLLEELKAIPWLSRSTSLLENTWKTIFAALMISSVVCNQTSENRKFLLKINKNVKEI
jgi:hypothetical protein